MSYVLWLAFFIWMPIIFLWWRYVSLLSRYKKTFLMSVLSALLVSVPWDKMAVENEIWFFPKEGVLGISIGGLPLEEYLFISTVTLLVVTTTIIFKYQKSRINLYVGK